MGSEVSRLLHRTVGCGQVSEADADSRREVVLTGWVHRRRDLGNLIFVEMRDATGRVQVVFDPSSAPDAHGAAQHLHAEDVVGIRGTAVPREAINPDHPTGRVEVRVAEMVIHNRALSVPFPVDEDLREHEIPLELCPSSNVCLGVYPDYAAHPFRRLWDAGLLVTLNSDDPPMFGTDLNHEYEIAVEHFEFKAEELELLSLNALRASFLPAEEKTRLEGEFRTEFARLRQELS